LLILSAIIVGFYSAWSIGANDVANSMGTVVGSRALSLRQAIIIAAIFEFCGAVFVGSHVTNTVRKGIIDITFFSANPELLAYGMFAALLASAFLQHGATFLGMPISTTHAIVGSVFGFGLITAGVSSVHWAKIFSIAVSWILSPFLGGATAFVLFIIIRKLVLSKDNPYEAIIKVAPYLVFSLFTILVLSIVYKGLKNLHLDLPLSWALMLAMGIGAIGAFVTPMLLKREKKDASNGLGYEYEKTEKVFGFLQLFTCAYIAFAHGANDVANAMGPLTAIFSIAASKTITMQVSIPLWILILGGVGIVTGLATYGYKVLETIGKKITEITPSRGFCAEFGAATTVLLCSKLGLPISTTHTIVGAVIGVGYARGIATMNFRVIKQIMLSWALTIPLAAFLTVIIYKGLTVVFMP
jgi:PiT family inorganic phosphate transporter